MKILKEEKIEEFECPKCKGPLEFDGNEFRKGYTTLKLLFTLGADDGTTGNGWFECIPCNKRYLIKDYAKEVVNE